MPFIMLKIIYFSIGFVTYEFCYEKYVTLSSSFFAQDRTQTRSYPPALFWLGCVLIFDRAISFSVCVCVCENFWTYFYPNKRLSSDLRC